MKCDELKSLLVYSRDINENCDEEFVNFAKENGYEELVEKKKVIEAIAELKQFAEDACLERDDNQTAIDELQAENRRLRRALWLARAERAKEKQQLFYFSLVYDKLCIDGFYNPSSGRRELSPNKWIKVFNKVEIKCRAKAEEYK